MTDHIQAVRDGPVLILRFNRPKKKNAITQAMYGLLADALESANGDPTLRVCVLLGTPGCFTAGNDIADFAQAMSGGAGLGAVTRFLHALAVLERPLFAGLDGLAVGIGTTLLFHCDYVLATPPTVLRAPFTALGLTPEAGSSLLGPRLLGHALAYELLVMGEDIAAPRAEKAGLVNALRAPEDLEETLLSRAHRLATKPAAAVDASRKLMKANTAELLARIDVEAKLFAQRLASPEAQSAFAAFLKRDTP